MSAGCRAVSAISPAGSAAAVAAGSGGGVEVSRLRAALLTVVTTDPHI